MKPAINTPPKVVEITKYVFAAGVLAGTCYGSYQRMKAAAPAKPAPESRPKARAAAA